MRNLSKRLLLTNAAQPVSEQTKELVAINPSESLLKILEDNLFLSTRFSKTS